MTPLPKMHYKDKNYQNKTKNEIIQGKYSYDRKQRFVEENLAENLSYKIPIRVI